MNRRLALVMVFLLSTQCTVGAAAGDLSLLTDGGETDSLDRPLVLWTTLNAVSYTHLTLPTNREV